MMLYLFSIALLRHDFRVDAELLPGTNDGHFGPVIKNKKHF